MTDSLAFQASRRFYGKEYFPYGIDRSGEFARHRAQLLIDHGYAYIALETGERAPVNAEEARFIAVCRGERKARSDHEKAWCLFREKTSHPKNKITSFTSTKSAVEETASEESFDYDY